MRIDNTISWKRSIEILLGFSGAITCLVVSISFAASELSLYDGDIGRLLPIPGFYFIELAIIGLLGFFSTAFPSLASSILWRGMPWICAGILMAFVILGAWSIGFLLIPGMLAFLFTGFLLDRRNKGNVALHFILFISAGLGQSTIVLMLLFL